MISLDEPWPKWAGDRYSYRMYSVHYPYTPQAWENDKRVRSLCNTSAANLCTENEKKVTCGRCRASLGLRKY